MENINPIKKRLKLLLYFIELIVITIPIYLYFKNIDELSNINNFTPILYYLLAYSFLILFSLKVLTLTNINKIISYLLFILISIISYFIIINYTSLSLFNLKFNIIEPLIISIFILLLEIIVINKLEEKLNYKLSFKETVTSLISIPILIIIISIILLIISTIILLPFLLFYQ